MNFFKKKPDTEEEQRKKFNDMFYPETLRQENEKKERDNLVNELGDNLSPAEILYSTKDDLIKKKQELSSNKLQMTDTYDFVSKPVKKIPKPSFDSSITIPKPPINNDLNNAEPIETPDEDPNAAQPLLENKLVKNNINTAPIKGHIEVQAPLSNESFFLDLAQKPQPIKQTRQKEQNFIQKVSESIKEGVSNIKNATVHQVKNLGSKAADAVIKPVAKMGVNALRNNHKLMERLKKTDGKKLAKGLEDKYSKVTHPMIRDYFGPDAAGMLDIGRKKPTDPAYSKDAKIFDSIDDEKLTKYKPYIYKKLSEQFRDYATSLNIEKTKVYYFKNNSQIASRILNDDNFNNFLIANKNKIKNRNEKLSIEFTTGNLYYGIHFADIIDRRFDKQKNLHILIGDTNDFNKEKEGKNTNSSSVDNGAKQFIKAGSVAMDKGYIEPRLIMIEIKIPKEKLDKLWNK